MDSVSNFITRPVPLLLIPRIKYPQKGGHKSNMELCVFFLQLHIKEEATKDIFEGWGVFVFVFGPLNLESSMQSVALNRVVSKFGKRKIGWVYHHCSGQQGRKRSGYFQVYSGPWVLLVASFPDLENLEASHQNVILIISSATSWKEKEMSWLYNPQNPLGSRRWVEMQKLKSAFADEVHIVIWGLISIICFFALVFFWFLSLLILECDILFYVDVIRSKVLLSFSFMFQVAHIFGRSPLRLVVGWQISA